MREAVGVGGEPPPSSWPLFGVCPPARGGAARCLLSRLAGDLGPDGGGGGLRALHPDGVLLSEDQDLGTLVVTFDLPSPPPLGPDPVLVLVLVLDRPIAGGGLKLDLTFSGGRLQPREQPVCLSQGTKFLLLKPSVDSPDPKWRISIDTDPPDMRQRLKDIVIGGEPGSGPRLTPLLLISAETGAGAEKSGTQTSSQTSSQTSFLCELRRFLGDVLPPDPSRPPLLPLASLASLPPLALGPSSSEAVLAGVINSSAPTVFSFSGWGRRLPGRRGELALSPPLLEELGRRLELRRAQIQRLIAEEEEKVAPTAAARLERLSRLTAFSSTPPAGGGSQYCAFLLLKALQTVAHAFSMRSRLRAVRAGPDSPSGGGGGGARLCGLQSLTVSFEKLLLGPQTANINNCQGSCGFPLANGNNHAVLLLAHIERGGGGGGGGGGGERPPCCVPVAYDPMLVVDWSTEESSLSTKPDMIVKECGCR